MSERPYRTATRASVRESVRCAEAHCTSLQRSRHGFLLPLVMVAMILVAILASATSLGAWRATRASRLAWNGERAAQAADEGIAIALASWNTASFAAESIGARFVRTILTADGVTVRMTFARTAPRIAAIEAYATSRVSGTPDMARRNVRRAIWLDAPVVPLGGAFTVFGPTAVDTAASISGRDVLIATDGCGATRDTASAASVYSGSGAELAQFDAAWPSLLGRITHSDAVPASGTLGSWRAWDARVLIPGDSLEPDRVVLRANVAYDGLIVVDGDLLLNATLRVHGLLIVNGALEASPGTLDVQGAVIVRDLRRHGSTVGAASRIEYSPCLVNRAMTTVARPQLIPFRSWSAP